MSQSQQSNIDLAHINATLGRDAQGLVNWAVALRQPNIVTTNFRPLEAVILHMCAKPPPAVSESAMETRTRTSPTLSLSDWNTWLNSSNSARSTVGDWPPLICWSIFWSP